MTFSIQLDLLETVDEYTLIKKQLEAMQESNSNVRRGLFARMNALSELVVKQQAEIEDLKKKILL